MDFYTASVLGARLTAQIVVTLDVALFLHGIANDAQVWELLTSVFAASYCAVQYDHINAIVKRREKAQ